MDIRVKARGDLETGDHHTVEDTAITLGSALSQEIVKGIGSSSVPSGQSLARAAVRFGEVGYQGSFHLEHQTIAGMSLDNFGHFLRALAYNGGFNLFISAEGGDDRSQIEAMSMALGRAIKKAFFDFPSPATALILLSLLEMLSLIKPYLSVTLKYSSVAQMALTAFSSRTCNW
ncbi:MAG: imidazoleglycerol-phosphate dehydratase [Methanothrix sp.]|nr:imidazoleglycerol-phosphate dehydratase [Methanothrix sp.]